MTSSEQDQGGKKGHYRSLRENPNKKRVFEELSDEDDLSQDGDDITSTTEPPRKRRPGRRSPPTSMSRNPSQLTSTSQPTAIITPYNPSAWQSATEDSITVHVPGTPQPGPRRSTASQLLFPPPGPSTSQPTAMTSPFYSNQWQSTTEDSTTVHGRHQPSPGPITASRAMLLPPTPTIASRSMLPPRRPTATLRPSPTSSSTTPSRPAARLNKAKKPTFEDQYIEDWQETNAAQRTANEEASNSFYPPGFRSESERHGSSAATDAIRQTVALGLPVDEEFSQEFLEQAGFRARREPAVEDPDDGEEDYKDGEENPEDGEEDHKDGEESEDDFLPDYPDMSTKPYDPFNQFSKPYVE
jgi:hypothetical protein